MDNPKLAYTIAEFAQAVGISRSKAYQVVASGEVRSVRIGGVRRVPVVVAEELVKGPNAVPNAVPKKPQR